MAPESGPGSFRPAAGGSYARIEKAIRYLMEHRAEQPDLGRVAAAVGMSEFHFQRLFQRWAGVSPKRFLQFLTAEGALRHLRADRSALETTIAVGLSSTSRLHDLMVTVHAATPGEIRTGGEGLEIRYGVGPSPFGLCLIAATDRGVCEMGFAGEEDAPSMVASLRERWPAARHVEDPTSWGELMERIFSPPAADRPLPLLLRGTNFQVQVWRALLEVPPGSVTTYGELAARLGAPGASRAVGGAVGANPIAFLVPCHRVIRASGALGDYRWGGGARKQAMLAWEAARVAGGGR